MKADIRRLELQDKVLEKHITTKFEETNNRQQNVNEDFGKDLAEIKAKLAILTSDGEGSLASKIANKVKMQNQAESQAQ